MRINDGGGGEALLAIESHADEANHPQMVHWRIDYLSSMISSTTLRLVRDATALRMVRIDFAVRPCLPITRPRSSLATRNSSTDAVSPWVSLTSTAVGLFTSCCARNWTSSFIFGSVQAEFARLWYEPSSIQNYNSGRGGGLPDQFADGLRRPRTGFQPMLYLFLFQRHLGRREGRIVGADLLDEAAVAR